MHLLGLRGVLDELYQVVAEHHAPRRRPCRSGGLDLQEHMHHPER
jgi:hypothetical protein